MNNLSYGLLKMKRVIEHPLDRLQTTPSEYPVPLLSPFC